MSEGTKHQLVQEKKNVAEQRNTYREAQGGLKEEINEREATKDRRRADKAAQRKEDQVLRQQRYGRWRMGKYFLLLIFSLELLTITIGNNGWKSVVEPELSPIVQSTFGSPIRGKSSFLK